MKIKLLELKRKIQSKAKLLKNIGQNTINYFIWAKNPKEKMFSLDSLKVASQKVLVDNIKMKKAKTLDPVRTRSEQEEWIHDEIEHRAYLKWLTHGSPMDDESKMRFWLEAERDFWNVYHDQHS